MHIFLSRSIHLEPTGTDKQEISFNQKLIYRWVERILRIPKRGNTNYKLKLKESSQTKECRAKVKKDNYIFLE